MKTTWMNPIGLRSVKHTYISLMYIQHTYVLHWLLDGGTYERMYIRYDVVEAHGYGFM